MERRPALGVVGLGQWFEHLSKSFSDNGITVAKAAGRKPFSERREQLASLGISRDDYFTGNADGTLPEGFFNGIDCAYIASSNSVHRAQTAQALESGKDAIVEKTLATNERDFSSMMDLISKGNYGRSTYVHLHYIHKQLTLAMDGILSKVEEGHGKASAVAATFFERHNNGDAGRKWIFSKKEGGIFMDWIHPYEVLFHGAKADSMRISSVKSVLLSSYYSTEEPSGVEAVSSIGGRHFSSNARAAVRIGKGAPHGMKRVRFYFDDAWLDFDFPGHKDELAGMMGSWKLVKEGRTVEEGRVSGRNTSELFASDIVSLCNGTNNGISMEELRRLYEPQWQFQNMRDGLEGDSASVSGFVEDGLGSKVYGT